MKVTILGCGGAAGVPGISTGWGACDPLEPRNRRLRSSIMIEEQGASVLVDASPDLRQQLLEVRINRLDGLILTHDHADHLHGIDDLREINRVTREWLPVFGYIEAIQTAQHRFDYAFAPMAEIGPVVYRPLLKAHEVCGSFTIGAITVMPFEQDHGYCRSMGIRIGNFAYSTDVVRLSEEAFRVLLGIDTWVVGCLVNEPHVTHAHVDQVLEWVDRVKPRRTVLTHMGSRLDYGTLRQRLPDGVIPAHDGLVLEIP